MTPRSPLAPDTTPELPAIKGVRLDACEAGIRYKGRTDLMLVLLPEGTKTAGVFTRSRTASAPVDWCKQHISGGSARALVVNSGNANAFTGKKGREAVRITAEATAKAVNCPPETVFLASTGVIGEAMDASAFAGRLADLAASACENRWREAAEAIMTTDTFVKMATRQVNIGDETVTINGFAKGSGMIAPDMATMLAFVFTDADINSQTLQTMLAESIEDSFNAITIDSDTSTSDTVLAFATGEKGGTGDAGADAPVLATFRTAFNDLLLELAQLIVRDGEGAQKFVTIRVTGAVSKASARIIAKSIANSPLVKTAIAGEDPNWGRIVMAVGKAGEEADRDKLDIWIGEEQPARDGELNPAYSEQRAAAYMKGDSLTIRVDLGLGKGEDTVWTCDLTHQYIDINADYRS
jgi:glutamate N-acetyltransferase/amino-acid N-acetyltransferase